MKNLFSIKEAVVFGWHKVKAHSGVVFGVVLTMFALEVASSVIDKSLNGSLLGGAASVVLAVAGVVLSAGMTLIFLKLARNEHAEYRQIVPDIKLVWKYFCVSILSAVIVLAPLALAGVLSTGYLYVSDKAVFMESVDAFEAIEVADKMGREEVVDAAVAQFADTIAGFGAALAVAVLILIAGIVAAAYLGVRYSMTRLAVLDGRDITESLTQSSKLTLGVKWRLVLFLLALFALNLLGLVAFVVGLLLTVPISLIAYSHVYLKLKAHHGHN